jgi:predicted dehydrogenase
VSDAKGQIRLGLVGCGRIAQTAHLPAIEKAGNVRLVAVSDPSEKLSGYVGKRYGAASFTDTNKLLEQDLDAVLIAAPDRFHLPLGLRAIEMGKHVLMEKPLAETTAEARELVEAAAAAGLKLQVGNMKRHDPAMAWAGENIGRIGPIHSMVTWYRVMKGSRAAILQTVFPVVVDDEKIKVVEDEIKAHASVYRLATHGAHVFDTMRFFAGDLAWITGHAAEVGGDWTWHGEAGIAAGGGLISYEMTASVHSEWAEGCDIFGEFGHIKTRSPYVFTKLGSWAELYVESERVAQVPHFGDTNPYKRQIEAFARAILEDLPVKPAPAEGVKAVTLIEAVAESCANDGRKVALR